MSVLVDTGLLVAAVNGDDRLHKEGRATLERLTRGAWGQPFTSDFIVAEAFNFLRQRTRQPEAARGLATVVFGGPSVRPLVRSIFRVHSTVLAPALQSYLGKWDARLSLTDWTSVELVQRHRVDAVATFDAGFRPWVTVVP